MDNQLSQEQIYEMAFDDLRTRLAAVEKVLTALPNIVAQPDVSRPAGLVVEPAAQVLGDTSA